MVCPFYGKSEDYCDVGSGYISAHDAKTISTYCSCRYNACTKYHELTERCPELLRETTVQDLRPTPSRKPVIAHEPVAIRDRAPIAISFRNKWPLPFQMRYVSANYNPNYQIPKEEKMNMAKSTNKGWTVVLAGTGINLALGILYAWSIFKSAISDSIKAGGPGAFNWDPASINDPYAVCCLVFAAAMILAGKLQDKFGPKITCIIGGLLVGSGFVWISQTTSYAAWVVGFGVLAGGGMGFGYSAATPPALKWFPPAKTGLIAGIVVSGFGLASVYIAPLATYLLGAYGLQKAMLVFGLAFTVVVCSLALLISNPPAGYVADLSAAAKKASAKVVVDVPPSKLFTDIKFYTLWLCYFIGAGAGLMVIGSAKGLAKASMGEMAFLVVAIMSIGNAGGRLIAGVVSDKLGRANTLTFMLVFQSILMFAAIPGLTGKGNPVVVALLVTFMVFNYGTNLALFPSFAKDYWGMKHFGMNYGILFSAWGIGGLLLVRVSEMLKVKTGGVTSSFAVAGVMLLVGAMMSLSLRARKAAVAVEETATAGAFDEEDLALQETNR